MKTSRLIVVCPFHAAKSSGSCQTLAKEGLAGLRMINFLDVQFKVRTVQERSLRHPNEPLHTFSSPPSFSPNLTFTPTGQFRLIQRRSVIGSRSKVLLLKFITRPPLLSLTLATEFGRSGGKDATDVPSDKLIISWNGSFLAV